MLFALAVIAAIAAAPKPAAVTVEDLGQPAIARNILEGRVVVSRKTGKEMLVLSNNNEFTGAELIFVDLQENTGQLIRLPAGAGAEALTEIPGDRLALGTFYDGTWLIFDLKKMEIIKTIPFPGQTYLWGFAMGSDGRIYGGTFPGGKLGALDLNTYALEDLGAPAAPNYYLRSVVATPDGRILCHFIVEKPTWLVFDPATKTFDPVSEELRGVRFATRWSSYIVSSKAAFQGADLHPVPTPFPVPHVERAGAVRRRAVASKPNEGDWSVDTLLTTPNMLYIVQGSHLWKYRKDDQKLTVVASIDLRGGRLFGEISDGRLVGVRGQDYFVLKPGDTKLELRPIPGHASPRTISFLRADPKGRIWGGPPYGQTLFWMDPATKKVVNTANISDTGGEVYDVAFLNGVTYAAAYYGGDVIRYDSEKPWDEWNQKNPRTIATIGPEFIRPTGGIIVGPGQKLYSGWTARAGYGGAVAVTEPSTGKTDVLRNPLGEQQIMGVATDGKLLYVGSGLGGNGLPTKTGESSQFGIIDPTTKKVLWQQAITGAERVRVIGYDAATHIVSAIVDAHIRLFDTSTRTFLGRGQDAPTVASWSNALPGDGKLYYGNGKQVLALDLSTGTVETIADVPGYVNNVTTGPDGTIYFGIGAGLYAIRRTGH